MTFWWHFSWILTKRLKSESLGAKRWYGDALSGLLIPSLSEKARDWGCLFPWFSTWLDAIVPTIFVSKIVSKQLWDQFLWIQSMYSARNCGGGFLKTVVIPLGRCNLSINLKAHENRNLQKEARRHRFSGYTKLPHIFKVESKSFSWRILQNVVTKYNIYPNKEYSY